MEDIEGPDRGTDSFEVAASQLNHAQTDSATTPAGSGEPPECSDEPKEEWTIIPNRCKKGCDCEYCVEESQRGQESY